MNRHSPNTISPELRAFLHSRLGLFYTEKQDEELSHKLKNAALAFGYQDPNQFTKWLLCSSLNDKQTGDLASYLTIGETYFFREKKSFDFLEQIYLPGLIRKRFDSEKHLSIWCAGCATGEEAYSLAIAVRRTIPDIDTWNISILATDINRIFLEKARRGVYTKWSFRTNGEGFKQKYFTKVEPNEYHINPEIKRMVKFSWLNLISESHQTHARMTSNFDIIFCRNVLIYFSPEGHQIVTNHFYSSLVKGGILVVSPVEMMGIVSSKFNKISYSGFTIFQKSSPQKSLNSDNLKIAFAEPNIEPSKELPNNIRIRDSHETLHREVTVRAIPIPVQQVLPISSDDYEMAESFFNNGFLAEAESLLSSLHEQVNNQTKAILLLAKIKANQGKLKDAKNLCEKGIQEDKLNYNFYYLLANILQELELDEQAASLLKQALYLKPDFVLAHFSLGTLSLKQGNHEEGMKSFKRATLSLSHLNPDDILPESDGITVARFREIINTIRR